MPCRPSAYLCSYSLPRASACTSNKIQILRQYFIVALLALACFSPWLVRNTLWASNPLYPYLSSIFGQHIPRFDSGLMGLNPIQQRLMLYGESIPELLLLPIRIFLGGEDDNPRLFDGRLSPLLLIGIIFGLFCCRNPKYRQLTFFSIAFILFALFSSGARSRYLAPTFVVMAALGGAALAAIASKNKSGLLFAHLLILFQIVASLIYIQKNYPFSEALAFAQRSLSKSTVSGFQGSGIPRHRVLQFFSSQVTQGSPWFTPAISSIYTIVRLFQPATHQPISFYPG